jgi:hypothetical protein
VSRSRRARDGSDLYRQLSDQHHGAATVVAVRAACSG